LSKGERRRRSTHPKLARRDQAGVLSLSKGANSSASAPDYNRKIGAFKSADPPFTVAAPACRSVVLRQAQNDSALLVQARSADDRKRTYFALRQAQDDSDKLRMTGDKLRTATSLG
jgi:hypothetical protein